MAKADANKSEALTKAQTAALARPAFIDDQPIEGFEGMTAKHTAIARLAVAQSMSKATKRANAAYIEGLQEGMLYNSLSREIYGESIDVIPLFFFTNRIMFKDLDQGGGILCMAPDGVSCQLNNGGPCLHGNFGPGGEKPECTEFFNYPALIIDKDGKPNDLIVLSFKSTAQKRAKDWNARMRQLRASMFLMKWRITADPDKKDKFDFFNVKFDFLGYVDQQEMAQSIRQTFSITREGFKTGAMTVDAEDPDEFNHGKNQEPKNVTPNRTYAAPAGAAKTEM